MVVAEELDIWGKPVTGTHPFKWALDTLTAGGRVRREIWAEGSFLRVNQHNVLVMFHPEEKRSPMQPLSETRYDLEWYEMSAVDWMEP
jgi:hypothetical protein